MTRNDVVMSLVLGLIVVAVVVATIMLPPNVTTAPPRPSDVIAGAPAWADTSNDSTERTAP